MKYYVMLTVMFNDGTADKLGIYTYETEKEAVARFHSEMGSWMTKENVSHVLCMAINSDGGIYKNEYYNGSTIPNIEPEETEE